MVSKKRKELRRLTNENVDKAASGELTFDTLKNTVVAMAKGVREERKLDREEMLSSLGVAVSGGVIGKMSSDIQGKLSQEERDGFKSTSISDADLLSRLQQVEMDAGLSGQGITGSFKDIEFGD